MIFRLYTVYNKHEVIKIGNQTSEKSKVLSQVHEYFCYRLKDAELDELLEGNHRWGTISN